MTKQTGQAEVMERIRGYASFLYQAYRDARKIPDLSRMDLPTDPREQDLYIERRARETPESRAYRNALMELQNRFWAQGLERLLKE